jgi:F-type H+-transporting ATPase subunit epsilon
MADGTFAVQVVTPEAKLLEGDARAVVLRSSDGELTVLDGHTPLITDVVIGQVRVDRDEGEVVRLAVHGGFLQVETGPGLDGGGDAAAGPGGWSTRVTLLAGVAERAEEIDVARAERARAEAQSRVEDLRSHPGAGRGTATPAEDADGAGAVEDAELVAAEAALRRAEVRLEVAAAAG